MTQNYQNILALIFAIKEINENVKILSNASLGFHIYDNHMNTKWNYHSAMQLISLRDNFIPNYKCNTPGHLIAVMERFDLESSQQIKYILDIYKIPQLHHFLKQVSFNNSAGENIFFDQNGVLVTDFDIINWVTFPNHSFVRVKVGKIDPRASLGQGLIINTSGIVWHSWFQQEQPISMCIEKCRPGYSKQKKLEDFICCYDCIPCPEGKISDEIDMIDCSRCQDDHYPNKDRNQCIPKIITFLSYEEPLGLGLSIGALSFSLVTTLVLGTFIKHHNTPIVKASNQTLSYTLLVSLLLCFLCVLLFIGQPQKTTCLIRNSIFAIVFSMTISLVFAKTVTVVLAFMVTTPSSRMEKWMSKGVVAVIVFSCTLIQVIICVILPSISPPFLDFDMHSETETIILTCNISSVATAYSGFAYMVFQAIVTFIVAYLARNLPSSLNEAKFITFSMLIFCIVWAFFIPIFLSTKGKQMVAMEILAILVSSAGLLSFIFFPKCFVIVLRPELNKKGHILKRNQWKTKVTLSIE
nr:vomeronasal type-2 receptor 26-like [Anolis sagrei ordinatus]